MHVNALYMCGHKKMKSLKPQWSSETNHTKYISSLRALNRCVLFPDVCTLLLMTKMNHVLHVSVCMTCV